VSEELGSQFHGKRRSAIRVGLVMKEWARPRRQMPEVCIVVEEVALLDEKLQGSKSFSDA
jgi:hypothetical protein